MTMWKTARKAAVAASATIALLGTVPAEAGTLADPIANNLTPWDNEWIVGPECPSWSLCIWPYTDWIYGGQRFFTYSSGDRLYPCQGVRFEGSGFQDHIYSFKNHTSGLISFWNRAADGSYNYSRLGTFGNYPPISNFTNGRKADAFVYDPRGDCKILTLDHYTDSGGIQSAGLDAGQDDPGYGERKVLKVDPGGATARAVS